MEHLQFCLPTRYGTKRKKIVVLDCQSCGNCEKNFHKLNQDNINIGFCLRFKENTPLAQINANCWTSLENPYYKTLYLSDEKQKSTAERLSLAKIKNLKINLDNQLFLF